MRAKKILKPLSLLLLRLGTGLLLILWGSLRLTTPEAGPGLADKYYEGFASVQGVQLAFGAFEVALGLCVCLGLFRRLAYAAQAVLLILATLAISRYLVDPLGLWLLDPKDSQILFFPSLTLAAASLVLVAFRDCDHYALDEKIRRRG
jgi:uncharacterized membrane protein YphA (DoxX/SURF4 family)